MTRKKKILMRNPEATKLKLIAGTGAIVKEKGFGALTSSAVTRYIGRDRTAVNKNFGSLAGLQRAYINQKDYWGNFFAQFVPKGGGEEQIRLLFLELMQENFRFFWDDAEMQRLIHWQMGEKNALMRSISDERELAGDKLLKLTDGFFAGTGTSFRMVMAILLYGTYGMVLHARSNGSTVCGVDINKEQDWQMMHRTITQILNWAWEAGLYGEDGMAGGLQKNRKKIKSNMNYAFEVLDGLSEEIAVARLAGKRTEQAEADTRIVEEVKRLKRLVKSHLISLQNVTQITTYLQVNLHTLVGICDRLYLPEREHNPEAVLVLELLESVRGNMSGYIPANLAVPALLMQREVPVFAQRWALLSGRFKDAGVADELIVLAGIPFERFMKGGMVWSCYRYLRMYARELELLAKGLLNNETLRQALVSLGFNSVRFTAYYAGLIGKELSLLDEAAVTAQLRVLGRHRAEIGRLKPHQELKYNRYRQPVREELLDWLSAEQDKLFSEEEQRLSVIELMDEIRQWLKMQY